MHNSEILFWHSDNNIIEYVLAYWLHKLDFKYVGYHSIVRFWMQRSFGITEAYRMFQTCLSEGLFLKRNIP